MADNEDDAMPAAADAVAWHLRLPTASADEWLVFTAWLEADAAHARAYDALSRADAELEDALVPPDWSDHVPPVAANDDRPPARRRWVMGAFGGLAAVGLAGAVLMLNEEPASAARIVETPAGIRRAIVLADGSRIEMNGSTRLAIDERASRLVTLERGEATFRVTHDAARPFVVQSGETRLQDVGTVFNVTRVGPHLGVQVAEGAVLFQPDRDRIMLTSGAALSHVDGEAPRMSGIAVGDVGGWRQGRLVFQQTPVRLVAAALARSTGATVDVAPALADTPFTGSIRTTGDADRIVPRAAALIGARAVQNGAGRWTLVGGGHAGP
ncbi:FecR family protein [Sphingomonas mollis]|uniref:FecR domain-containing protein n=1 Tax=Sphingomonas mollis TaxID=2795726 RepID=A0ABS0XTY3_9SPHN|nr:FecR domain-containing protein [Sphingomonas sp. BT553]MBJ6123507.1 FecR domain-containing protein [Sphingomonas sp. BT553]